MRISAIAFLRSSTPAFVALGLGFAPIWAPAPAGIAHAEERAGLESSDELLIGTWEVDGEATLEAMGSGATPEQQAWLSEQGEGASIRVVFRRDGTATVTDPDGATGLPESATWATVSTDGARIAVLLLDASRPDVAAPQTLTIDFSSQRQLVLNVDSQPVSLVMARAATAPGDTAATPVRGVGVNVIIPEPRPITGDPVTVADETNLYGTWVADMGGLLAQESANMPPEQFAMMQALMSDLEITFTFVDDGTAVMYQTALGQSETNNGTWVFESAAANTVTFVLTETPAPGEAQGPPIHFTATFVSTNNMALARDRDPQTIPFYRQ
jgi:hypothetical protein